MPLILAHPSDGCASWLAAGLARRGVSVVLVTSDELGRARFIHRVGAAGADVNFDLVDGSVIRFDAPSAVINRLDDPPALPHRAAANEVAYARQELQAIWWSWLHALPCRVLNRPSATSLAGARLSPAEWCLRAGRVGLPTRVVRVPSAPGWRDYAAASALVVAGAVFGHAAMAPHTGGLLALADAVGVELLAVQFDRDEDGELVVVGASAMPDLRPGGTPLLDHLAEVLT